MGLSDAAADKGRLVWMTASTRTMAHRYRLQNIRTSCRRPPGPQPRRWQGWQLEKTRLEKTRVLLLGFIGFFQDNLEKTQENWVFSRFCILRCKIIAFFHKKLGFFMQNCIFSSQIATKNSKIHIQVCICNLSLILFPKTVLFLFMMSRLYLFQYYYF